MCGLIFVALTKRVEYVSVFNMTHLSKGINSLQLVPLSSNYIESGNYVSIDGGSWQSSQLFLVCLT